MKKNRAPGEDGISAELLKAGGKELSKKVYVLILEIWIKEKMPAEWKMELIIPIYKKGERRKCSNYRPIMLLNVRLYHTPFLKSHRMPLLLRHLCLLLSHVR